VQSGTKCAKVVGVALAISLGLCLMTACTGMTRSAPGVAPTAGNGGSGSGSGSGGSSSGNGPSSFAQYLYTGSFDNNGNPSITGFRINNDGTLSPITITPSAYPLSATKGRLLGSPNCSAPCQLSLYKVSAATGDLSLEFSTPSMGGFAVFDPSGRVAYEGGGMSPTSTVSAFSVGSSGFSPLPGSPYAYAIGGGSNPVSATTLLLDPGSKFLYMLMTPQNEHTPGDHFAVAVRNPDGSLRGLAPNSPSGGGSPGCSDGDLAIAEEQGTSLVFQSCAGDFASDFNILSFTVDQTTGNVVGINGFAEQQGGGMAKGLAVDGSGKWLVATDVYGNSVHVLAITAVNGGLSETADHIFPTGSAPTAVAFDASGKFLYVLNSDLNSVGPKVSGNVSAYNFDAGTGMLTPIVGSPYITQPTPHSLVIAQAQ
jgi:Lactonase, 7-bladed beta-propeller